MKCYHNDAITPHEWDWEGSMETNQVMMNELLSIARRMICAMKWLVSSWIGVMNKIRKDEIEMR